MKLVLDTNIAVSGLLWGGGCGEFFTLAELERVKLFTSDALLLELADVLPRRKLARRLVKRGVSAEEVLGSYRASCSVLTNVPVIKVVAGDPDDDVPLACAAAARADLLVTGDRLLLHVGSYAGVRIVTPSAALRSISGLDPANESALG